MAYRAYVGNFPFTFTKADLENLFRSFGVVKTIDLILDRETGRPRGFGFVEMETSEQLAAAIGGLHGSLVSGRPLTVTEARERTPGGPRAPGADRPAWGERPPRSFDRPAGDRPSGIGARPGPERGAGPRSGAPTRAPGGPIPPRVGGPGPDSAPGPAKRDRSVERRNPKMDGYERDHKDWRRYSDDDDDWQ